MFERSLANSIICLLALINYHHCNILAWPDPYSKTQGEIWPLPQHIERQETIWLLDPKTFVIHSASKCDIIEEAIKRYSMRMHTPDDDDSPRNITDQSALKSLEIVVEGGCPNGVPQLGMDESYKLNVTSSDAILKAVEVWGALRGLESFSHMVYYNASLGHMIRSAIIKDFPRFPHRGVLLDTSRHFLSTNVLKANIELMAQNKFNVFHWHIVDNEAFPYNSEALPSLSKGSYTPRHMYSLQEIKDIIAYARLRGVRVIVEFDTPGHMKSWGKGMPILLARCFDESGNETFDRSLIDPTIEDTWDVLLALFEEVFQVFLDNYVHLGGDETQFWIPNCWEHNRNITAFMSLYGLKTARDLEQWYFTKLIAILNGPHRESKKKFIVWQEVLDMGIEVEDAVAHVWKGSSYAEQMKEMNNVTASGHYALLSACWYLDYISTAADWFDYYKCEPQEVLDMGIEVEDAVAHVWKGSSYAEQMKEMNNVTASGHYALLSACWYLDYISTAADWFDYYKCEPQGFNGSRVQKSLVLGGEAALWGEWVDESNVVARLWPRASAVAERLWSDAEQTKEPTAAWPRFRVFQFPRIQARSVWRAYAVNDVPFASCLQFRKKN
uniref:Beta-hexosaminidase n=1 Tax=Ascaris lumbricoides TaxID=6252 RepID=A0A0M3IDG3_ASCLU